MSPFLNIGLSSHKLKTRRKREFHLHALARKAKPTVFKKSFNSTLLTSLFVATLSHASTAPFRVVIDPGHGGSDEGTVVLEGTQKISEKEMTLILAREAALQLRARG